MIDLADLLSDPSSIIVLLNSEGTIVGVSDAWKRMADESGLALTEHGIGHNYLKYCISNDIQSPELLRGLKKVLDRRMGYFSILYSCHSNECQRWFLMAAFAAASEKAVTAVVHLDVSHLFDHEKWSNTDGQHIHDVGSPRFFETLSRVVSQAVVGKTSVMAGAQPATLSDRKRLDRLTERQSSILKFLATGASNADIAKTLKTSQSTVKTQVAVVLRKLEVANRTQAALFARKIGLGDKQET